MMPSHRTIAVELMVCTAVGLLVSLLCKLVIYPPTRHCHRRAGSSAHVGAGWPRNLVSTQIC